MMSPNWLACGGVASLVTRLGSAFGVPWWCYNPLGINEKALEGGETFPERQRPFEFSPGSKGSLFWCYNFVAIVDGRSGGRGMDSLAKRLSESCLVVETSGWRPSCSEISRRWLGGNEMVSWRKRLSESDLGFGTSGVGEATSFRWLLCTLRICELLHNGMVGGLLSLP